MTDNPMTFKHDAGVNRAFKFVRPDGGTSYGFVWPIVGDAEPPVTVTAECPTRHSSACPKFVGDGLCVAKTVRGAQSGGIPMHRAVGLVVEWDDSDTLASGPNKVRVASCRVVGSFNPLKANLRGANLRDANLRDANLRDANLWYADLWYANLRGANLRCADLRDANLWYADLRDADLRDADLRDADLRDANLRDANLRGANLRGANLRGAYLRGAYLRDADLLGADLRGALQ